MSASARSSRAHFPAIFGPDGDLPLDADGRRGEIRGTGGRDRRGDRRAARTRARWRRASCASPSPTWRTRSSRSRCRRATTSPRFALQCFGGAGGQHACLVADELGMETVFIHPFAGVLSAYGMGLADQAVMREQAVETAARRGGDARARRELGRRARRRGARRRCWRRARSPRASTRAPAAPALCRHRGGAARAAARTRRRDRRGLHRGAPRALRLRHAGAPDRGRGGRGRGDRGRRGGA